MKRKDLVHTVSDNILSSFFPSLDLNMKNLIADAVISECEKYGMLPPEAIFTDPGHFPGDSFDYRANKWEEE